MKSFIIVTGIIGGIVCVILTIIAITKESFFLAIIPICTLAFIFNNTIKELVKLEQQTIIDEQQDFILKSQKLIASLGYNPPVGFLCNIPAGIGNIYIDTDTEKIILILPDLTYFIYSAEQIIDAAINENNSVLTISENKNIIERSIGGALIGGVAGAVIGGITSQQTSSNQIVNELSLMIHFDDLHNHTCEIKWITEATARNSPTYINAITQAKHFHGLLTVLINRAQNQQTET